MEYIEQRIKDYMACCYLLGHYTQLYKEEKISKTQYNKIVIYLKPYIEEYSPIPVSVV